MVFKQISLILGALLGLGAISLVFTGIPRGQETVTQLDYPPFQAVYILHEPDAWGIDIALIYERGEVDNTYVEGLAHYVEHLAWANVFSGAQAGVNRHSNAWTSATTTMYFQSSSYDGVQAAMQRLVNTAKPLQLDADYMTKEVDIIQRERDQRRLDRKTYDATESEMRVLSGDSVFARSVIGTRQQISQFDADLAKKLHGQTHHLNAATLVIKGDISVSELQSFLNELEYPTLQSTSETAMIPEEFEAPFRSEDTVSRPDMPSALVHYNHLFAVDGCRSYADCDARVDMVWRILTSTRDGGLVSPLQYDAFLARKMNVALWRYWRDAFVLRVEMHAETDIATSTALAQLEQTLKDIANTGVSVEVFDILHKDAVTDVKTDELYAQDEYDNIVNAVSHRRPYYDAIEYYQAMAALSVDDINEFLKALNDDSRIVIRRYNP